MGDIYEGLARSFNISPQDPRIGQFLQKAVEKGYDPMEFASFVSGQTKDRPQPKRPEDVPDFVVKGAKPPVGTGPEPAQDWQPTDINDLARSARAMRHALVKERMKTGAGGTFLDTMGNAATFGIARRLEDAITPEDLRGVRQEAREESEAESPLAAGAGEVAGSLLPMGGPGAIGNLAGRAVGLGRNVANASRAARLLGGAARGAAAAELTAPLATGIRSYVESGADPERGTLDRAGDAAGAAWETAKNPAVPILGAALGAGGGYIENAREASPSYQTLKRYDARPTLGSPAKGQIFEHGPVAEGLDAHGNVTEGGVGHASRAAAEDSLGMLRREQEGVQAAYGRAKDALPPGQNQDITPLADEAWKIIQDETSAPASRAIAQKILEEIEPHRVSTARTLRPGQNYVSPEASVQKIKVKVGDMTGHAASTEGAQGHIVSALPKKAQELASQTQVGPLNEQYADSMQSLRAAHRAIGAGDDITAVGATDDAIAKKIADRIASRGRGGETGGKYESTEQGDVFKLRPELEQLHDTAALLRARQNFELHPPTLGDLKSPLQYAGHLGEAAKFRVGAPALDYGAANAGTVAAGGPQGWDVFKQAYERERDQERMRAAEIRARRDKHARQPEPRK